MPNTTTLNPAETHLGAAYAAEQHLRRNGASLCNLLDDSIGSTALCDPYCAFDRPISDADIVEVAARTIERLLTDQMPSLLDRIGNGCGPSSSGLMRWHGTRVSERRARFHHAQ